MRYNGGKLAVVLYVVVFGSLVAMLVGDISLAWGLNLVLWFVASLVLCLWRIEVAAHEITIGRFKTDGQIGRERKREFPFPGKRVKIGEAEFTLIENPKVPEGEIWFVSIDWDKMRANVLEDMQNAEWVVGKIVNIGGGGDEDNGNGRSAQSEQNV